MLRACRQVLRRGGRIAFTTIELAPELAARERRSARAAAPRAAATRQPYERLLASAGFVGVAARDVTAEYLATTRAWLAHSEPRFEALAALDGRQAVDDRILGWRGAIEAIEAGWLGRTLYWAARP